MCNVLGLRDQGFGFGAWVYGLGLTTEGQEKHRNINVWVGHPCLLGVLKEGMVGDLNLVPVASDWALLCVPEQGFRAWGLGSLGYRSN